MNISSVPRLNALVPISLLLVSLDNSESSALSPQTLPYSNNLSHISLLFSIKYCYSLLPLLVCIALGSFSLSP